MAFKSFWKLSQRQSHSENSQVMADTLQFLKQQNYTSSEFVSELLAIQMIILRGLSYRDFATRTLVTPNSAPVSLTADNFLPRDLNHYKHVDCFENPIYLPVNDTPCAIFPWNNHRILENIHNINSTNPFNPQHQNLRNSYIYPLGIALCDGGNHSQLAAYLRGDVHTVRVTDVYNISEALAEVEKDDFSAFSQSDQPEWLYLMKIGVELSKYTDQFPKAIQAVV